LITSRRIHDYKIKVLQKNKPQTSDYIVLKRLAVQKCCNEHEYEERLREHILNNVEVVLNWKVSPPSIMYICYKPYDNFEEVHSQRYYDLLAIHKNEGILSRFEMKFQDSFYMNFKNNQHCSVPPTKESMLAI
jgi:hypothetical protein